jgi:16S rRNA A1518/A1519 N6-dimethyltransferase RsmA/KsgA/DIM1 with predicted DNA glycosylase/AP lyase activity
MMSTMTGDEALAVVADPAFDQHFLVSPEKLALLIAAAGIMPTDRVVEVGAGAGTVARTLPQSGSLTVVELDDRLIGRLRENVPDARIIQGDALTTIREVSCDVLISNLPNDITESLLDILPEIPFRTAVLTVGKSADLVRLGEKFECSEVTTISGPDFVPPQPQVSRIVRVVRGGAR